MFEKWGWGAAAGAVVGIALLSNPVSLNGASWNGPSCRPLGTKPFQGLSTPVAGVGTISEGTRGQYLIPFLSFDKVSGFSGSYKALLWDTQSWKTKTVGKFKATNGVLQFINLKGVWYAFSNSARVAGGAQIPTVVTSNAHGSFDQPKAIGVFSGWGEFISAAKSLNEERIGITGRDRMNGGFTNVFAQKIGERAWFAEPIVLDGKPTGDGFSTMIGYDRANAPWISYESQPSGAQNEVSVVTRTAQGWIKIPLSARHPANLVGAYLPAAGKDHERIALAWMEKDGGTYEAKSALLDLSSHSLSGERTIGSHIAGATLSPMPMITVSHDGKRATITLMSAETHQGWTSKLASSAFEPLKEYTVPAGQGVIGFPQAFYSACDDTPRLMVGVGALPKLGGLPDLGDHLKIETVSER
jgi:hypothetical protein